MAQYIDKSALIAEIEKKKIPFKKDIEDGNYPTYLCALLDFEDLLNTLEVKEVDFENELSYENYKSFFEKYPDISDDWGFEEAWTFAEYFYKLGLKAKKEE